MLDTPELLLQKYSAKVQENDSVKITLIDKLPYHTLMTELHEVVGGRVEPESVQVDLRKIFHRSKVEIVTEEVHKIDVDNQKLHTDFAEYQYDYLIIGTGSEPAYFGAWRKGKWVLFMVNERCIKN